MKVVIDLPYPKTWTVEGPRVEFKPGEVIIEFDYVSEQSKPKWTRLEFKKVIAFKYIEEVYGNLCLDFVSNGLVKLDIQESQWLQQLQEQWSLLFGKDILSAKTDVFFDYYHFGIWFGDEGCYEIVAGEFAITTF